MPRQAFFWQWVDQEVQRLVVGLIQMALAALLQEQLQAGWNQRTAQRQGWRNGYRRRGLMTPHGVLTIRVPRARQGTFDPTPIFERCRRRIADVERVLRHAYLLGVSTRDTAQLARQIFGGTLSHQTISRLMRWLDEQLGLWRTQLVVPKRIKTIPHVTRFPLQGAAHFVRNLCSAPAQHALSHDALAQIPL
jgi:transposase-like protein